MFTEGFTGVCCITALGVLSLDFAPGFPDPETLHRMLNTTQLSYYSIVDVDLQ